MILLNSKNMESFPEIIQNAEPEQDVRAMTLDKPIRSAEPPLIVPQSVKDLSFALFMGSGLDAKYRNIFIQDRNRKIVEFFSRPIAQVNRQYFKRQLTESLPDEQRVLIQEIFDSKEPYIDHFGRITFF